MKKTTCDQCGAIFEYEPHLLSGRECFPESTCEQCQTTKLEEHQKQVAEELRLRRAHDLKALIPPLYRTTDKRRLPAGLIKLVDSWQYGWKGLGLVGISGSKKTRTSALILERMHFEGRSIYFVSETRLIAAAINLWSDSFSEREAAKTILQKCNMAEVLLIDDLGKSRMSERAEITLYDLLEHRSSQMMPILWTSNFTQEELHEIMSPNRADSVIRRLLDFSEIISLFDELGDNDYAFSH
jgi:hypothetical protein